MREFGLYKSKLEGELEEEKIYERNRKRYSHLEYPGEFGTSKVEGGEIGKVDSGRDRGVTNADRQIKELKVKTLELKEEGIDLNHARRTEALRADLYRDNPMWSLIKSNNEQSKQMLEMAKNGGLLDFKKEIAELDKNIEGLKEMAQKAKEAEMTYIDNDSNMEVMQKLITELMAIKINLEGEMNQDN